MDIYFSEGPLLRWMNGISKQSTKANYQSAFRVYAQFTGLSAAQLIDEVLEDTRRDPRDQKDVLMGRVLSFYRYLKDDYEVKSKGRGPQVVKRKGISDKSANAWVNGIRSFYGTFDLNVRLKGRHALPKPRIKHMRMILNAAEVKVLLDNTRSLRDKAVILTLFQGGMDVSTLCKITYGQVKAGLDKDEHPLKLDLQRPKTGVEYYTFIGRDACEAIKVYIKEMESRGLRFTPDMLLFRKERGKGEAADSAVLQVMLKDVAIRSGFVDPETNGKDFNPVGAHAFRESFGSIMTSSGVPGAIVDSWLGHDIGEQDRAYKSMQFESVRKMYLEREKLLSISSAIVLDGEERLRKLEQSYENEAVENEWRRIQLEEQKEENEQLKKRIQTLEDSMRKTSDDAKKAIKLTDEFKSLLLEEWKREDEARAKKKKLESID